MPLMPFTTHWLYIIYMSVLMVIDFDCNEWLRWLTGSFFLYVFSIFRDRGNVNGEKSACDRAIFPVCCVKSVGDSFQVTDHLFILFICFGASHFSSPFLLSPHWGCQLQVDSSRWLSTVQTEPGVMCLCSVMQCAGAWRSKVEADWDSNSIIKGVKLLLPPLCSI